MFHVEHNHDNNSQSLKVKASNPVFLTCKDHLVSNEMFTLQYDRTKDMLITSPKPRTEDLEKYYQSDRYISHTDSKKGIVPFLYQTVKKYALRKKLLLVHKLNKGNGSLLDVGAGTGDFLVQAKNKGWDVSGVEINEDARNNARAKNVVLEERMSAFDGQQFDIITLWHVLEHIPNLDEMISELQRLLKPNGHLIIAVPNFKSYDARYYKEFWAAYDVPRHLWHFSQSTIPKLFPDLSLVKTKPMIFDSFYVSLISEEYKNKKHFSLRAFWVGFLSNIKALGSGEYSSLIYCLQKTK